MNKRNYIVYFVIIIVGFLHSPVIGALTYDLDEKVPFLRYKTLPRQLISSLPEGVDFVQADSLINDYFDPLDPAHHEGLVLLLSEESFLQNDFTSNSGLLLFLYMLKENPDHAQDTIILALALANGHLYHKGEEKVKQEVLLDINKQYHFYRTITAWQQGAALKYNLRDQPFLNKFLWAGRTGWKEGLQGKSITLEHYNKFVDKIENYEYLHNYLIARKVHEKDMFASLTKELEYTGHNINHTLQSCIDIKTTGLIDYKSITKDEEGSFFVDLEGEKSREDRLGLLNLQTRLLREEGYTVGNSTTTSSVKNGFYKALGIPSFIFHIKKADKKGEEWDGHFFTAHYNMFVKRWIIHQNYYPDENINLSFEVVRYFPHLSGQAYHTGLIFFLDRNEFKTIVDYGISQQNSGSLFFSVENNQPLPFNTKPLSDSDGDGISDAVEAEYKTDPAKVDTDNDGYTDLWEIEHGINPLAQNTRATSFPFAIDGLAAGHKQGEKGQSDRGDETGDEAVKETHDISGITCTVVDNALYVAVSFHNKIESPQRVRQELKITTINFEAKREETHFIHAFANHYHISSAPVISAAGSKETSYMPGAQFAFVEDAEWLIPLERFKGNQVISVQYCIRGFSEKEDEKWSNESTAIILTAPDFERSLPAYFSHAKLIKDQSGDVSRENPVTEKEQVDSSYDIKTFRIMKVDNSYFGFAAFYNDFKNSVKVNHIIRIRDQTSDQTVMIWYRDTADNISTMALTTKDKEGGELKQKDSVEYFIAPIREGYIFRFPVLLLEGMNNPEIQYQAGGLPTWNVSNESDTTGWLELR